MMATVTEKRRWERLVGVGEEAGETGLGSIYRWYRDLRELEAAAERASTAAEANAVLDALHDVERQVIDIRVPLAFRAAWWLHAGKAEWAAGQYGDGYGISSSRCYCAATGNWRAGTSGDCHDGTSAN